MSIPAPDICYEAISNRDSKYDGVFVTAVTSTKIYCRPSCPARTPLRKNVRFYSLPAIAEANGFRPCKRCHPREIDVRDEQASRVQLVCDYITEHLTETLTLDDLSAVVYWSPHHLQRTFKDVMGISPRQYTDAQRMKHFKHGLQEGASVLDAAVDAGFSSTSRLYEKTDDHIGMTPVTYQKGGAEMTIAYSVTDSTLGALLIARTERGICAVEMGDEETKLIDTLHNEFPQAEIVRDDAYLQPAMQQTLDYLGGWQPHLDLPLDIRMTAFQQRVLDELKRIPYGETRSYGDIAKAIGKPKAARAVGNVCNKNPVPIIIPCHRVVRSDGSIEGYAFGTHRKRILLDMERESVGEVE